MYVAYQRLFEKETPEPRIFKEVEFMGSKHLLMEMPYFTTIRNFTDKIKAAAIDDFKYDGRKEWPQFEKYCRDALKYYGRTKGLHTFVDILKDEENSKFLEWEELLPEEIEKMFALARRLDNDSRLKN